MWSDVYVRLGITPEDERLHRMILREKDRNMCSIAAASDLIEGERETTERHVQAMKWAVEQGEKAAPLTMFTVLKTHQMMFQYGGVLRSRPDHTAILLNLSGDMPVNHQPPAGHLVPAAVNTWTREAEARLSKPPRSKKARFELIAELHHAFECIHPFFDGNGRAGRALANYMAARLGLPFIKLSPKEKRTYIRALNDSDITRLARLFQKCTY